MAKSKGEAAACICGLVFTALAAGAKFVEAFIKAKNESPELVKIVRTKKS